MSIKEIKAFYDMSVVSLSKYVTQAYQFQDQIHLLALVDGFLDPLKELPSDSSNELRIRVMWAQYWADVYNYTLANPKQVNTNDKID